MGDVTFKELKAAVKDLNDSGLLAKKLKVIGVKTEEFKKVFMDAVEALPEEQDKNIPQSSVAVYNALVAEDALGDDDQTEAGKEGTTVDICSVFKKGYDPENADCQLCAKDFPGDYKECGEACSEVKKISIMAGDNTSYGTGKYKKSERDTFGFAIGSKNHMFVMSISERPMKMSEVKLEPWNNKKMTFYSVWKILKEKGVAKITDDGKMTIEPNI